MLEDKGKIKKPPIAAHAARHVDQRPTATNSEKERYRAALRTHRLSKRKEPLPNLRPWHCKAAVQELLLLAVDLQHEARDSSDHGVCIRILTGCCPEHVYGEADFSTFVDMGGQVRVLVWNEKVDVSGQHLRLLSERHPGQVIFRYAAVPLTSDPINHFLIVDEKAYRLEAPHEKCEFFTDMEPEIPARITFNDPEGARRLASAFDQLWNNFPLNTKHAV